MSLNKRQIEWKVYYRKYFKGRTRIKNADPLLKKDKLWCPICKMDLATLAEMKRHKYDQHSY